MIPTKPKAIRTWGEFVQLATTDFVGRWYFRGVLDDWPLAPSLERGCRTWKVPTKEIPNIEKRLLREFKRAYPRRGAVVPPANDDLAWLALIQHHGGPTRLLDWTYSPFVAAFFALDALLASRDKKRKAAIWALSAVPTSNKSVRHFLPPPLRPIFDGYSKTREGEYFRPLFLEASPPFGFVTPVNPYILNERLIAHQGLFLCPGDVSRSFEENLLCVPRVTDAANLRKILLSRSMLPDAFTGLRRMNITYASLFPGLDGYTRSMLHLIHSLKDPRLFHDPTDY